MECAESLRVQAYFDGEVEAATAFELERHIATCAECSRLLQELQQLRGLIRDNVTRGATPAAVRERIAQSLDREAPDESLRTLRPERSAGRSRPFWFGVISGAGGSAIAAGFAFWVFSVVFSHSLVNELVADHTHSLLASRLIEVVSTDQHTVKPWFAGRTDVSPVVADFAPQGFRLLGGRVDELKHRRAAVTVYQHGRHVINVFSFESGAAGLPADVTRQGYHLAFWKSADVGYCAVSDAGWSELQALQRLLQEQAARDLPQS